MFRYCIASPQSVVEDCYGARFDQPYRPNYNAFPSYRLPVITMQEPKKVRFIRWGFTEFVSGVKQLSPYTDSKGIITRKADKFDLLKQRVVVPANCVYLWHRINPIMDIPFLIRLRGRNKRPFSLAGYRTEQFHPKTGEPIEAFTLLYRKSEGILKGVCDYMPVILPDRHEVHWLKDNYELGNIVPYFQEGLSTGLDYYPISGAINDPRNNYPDLARAVGESYTELDNAGFKETANLEIVSSMNKVWEVVRQYRGTPKTMTCSLKVARSLAAENQGSVYGIKVQVDTSMNDTEIRLVG